MNDIEANKLNKIGDNLAKMLGLKVDADTTPDSDGRTRWQTATGNKTGLGLIYLIEGFIEGECERLNR
jgi:hypothetical protein